MRRVVTALILAAIAGGAEAASVGNVTTQAIGAITPRALTAPLMLPGLTGRAGDAAFDNSNNPDPSLRYQSGGDRSVNISAIARLGARWGRVTSMVRSIEHNRAVGGVANSYHLRGQAIDIARRPGVGHHDIAAGLRAAGYALLESLDEGDHSHFAFGTGAETKPSRARPQMVFAGEGDVTQWRVVSAPVARR